MSIQQAAGPMSTNPSPAAGSLGRQHLPVLARDVMTTAAITVEPTATVRDIAHVMLERDIRSVPVIDVGDLLVGIVSEADLISRASYPAGRRRHLVDIIDDAKVERRHHWTARAAGLTAAEIMTTDVLTCRPDEPLAVVTRRLLRSDVHALPVVDHGRLVGMIARHDVLRQFDRPDSEIRQRLSELLADPLWMPEGHEVTPTVRDGVVILEGSVRYLRDINLVDAIVREVPGVIEVVNRLTGREPNPKVQYAKDTDWR